MVHNKFVQSPTKVNNILFGKNYMGVYQNLFPLFLFVMKLQRHVDLSIVATFQKTYL